MRGVSLKVTMWDLLTPIRNDARLSHVHVSLVSAMIHQSFELASNPFQVSRRKLMEFSKIRSTATYHKCIRQLDSFGYIDYRPSYHPLLGSRIQLIVEGKCI